MFKRQFLIDQFFMQFIKENWSLTSLDNISSRFIIIIQNFIDKVLMVKRFTKSSKLIDMTLDKLHVFGDCLTTLDDVLKLILNFLNMPTRWTSICVCKCEPRVTRGGGLLNKGNQRSGNRTNKSTKKKFVMLNPREKFRIWSFLVSEASCGRWTRVRAINKFVKVKANEDSFNLKLSG